MRVLPQRHLNVLRVPLKSGGLLAFRHRCLLHRAPGSIGLRFGYSQRSDPLRSSVLSSAGFDFIVALAPLAVSGSTKGASKVASPERVMDVHPTANGCGLDRGAKTSLQPAKGGPGRVFRMHGVGRIHRLIGAQIAYQALVKRDELRLLFGRCDLWLGLGLGLAILAPPPGQKLDAARMWVLQIELGDAIRPDRRATGKTAPPATRRVRCSLLRGGHARPATLPAIAL